MASVAKDAEIGAAELDFVPAGDGAVTAATSAAMPAIAQYCNTNSDFAVTLFGNL